MRRPPACSPGLKKVADAPGLDHREGRRGEDHGSDRQRPGPDRLHPDQPPEERAPSAGSANSRSRSASACGRGTSSPSRWRSRTACAARNSRAQPADWRIQKARFLSSKNGRSRPIPRAIGSAGDWIFGTVGRAPGAVTRRSRVALSVAIVPHIEGLRGIARSASAAAGRLILC